MAVQDYLTLAKGTAITWMNTGGTKAMNLKNLANAGMRQGDKSGSLVDGTKGMPDLLEIVVEAKFQSAPNDGALLSLFLGWSEGSSGGNPGGLGDSDASVSNASQLAQLDYIGSLVCSNFVGTGVQRQAPMIVRPKAEYLIPVVDNESGKTTTNVDSETIVTITPYYRQRQS